MTEIYLGTKEFDEKTDVIEELIEKFQIENLVISPNIGNASIIGDLVHVRVNCSQGKDLTCCTKIKVFGWYPADRGLNKVIMKQDEIDLIVKLIGVQP